MKLCNKECTPCCDFCVHAEHEYWTDNDGHKHKGGPIACNLHNDEKHNNCAEGCGYCEDYYCFRIGTGKGLDGLEVTWDEYKQLEKEYWDRIAKENGIGN